MSECTCPCTPEADHTCPSPDVTINNTTEQIVLDSNYALTAAATGSATLVTIVFSLKDSEGASPATTFTFSGWLVPTTFNGNPVLPESNGEHTHLLALIPPNLQPGGATFDIVFVDGEATVELEHNDGANSYSYYLVIDFNGVVSVFGPYTIGT